MSNTVDFHFSKPEESPGFLLWQVTMLWQRKIRRALDQFDLTHTQFVLLATLAWSSKTAESVTQTEIATLSKTDRMMVSKVLRTLQKKGFVDRKEHLSDTRAKSVSLTPKGREILQKALKIVEQTDVNFFSVLKDQTETFNSNMLALLTKNEE